jgi:Spy/CpxP family protein refolding chaperone
MPNLCFFPSSRTPSRWMLLAAGVALGLALLAALPAAAQAGHPEPGGTPAQARGPRSNDPFADLGDHDSAEQEKRLRALNADRQKSMVSDANKLLKLVTELNAELTSSNPDSLSANQLRKLAEIEKLAHSVKDKMSTSVRGTPLYPQPFGRDLP